MAEGAIPPAEAPQKAVPALAGAKTKIDGNIIRFQPANFAELWSFINTISGTEMVPSADRGKPGQVLAKIQYGAEIGLSPMIALRYIAVLPNGLPTIWGDGAKMLVTSNPLCEGLWETEPHKVLELGYAECTIKRKGWAKPVTVRYTKEMAITAKLWGGTGDTKEKQEKSVWFKYPQVMLAWRAFHLCTQRTIPEALGGLVPREIANDYDIETTATKIEDPTPVPRPTSDAPAGAASREQDIEQNSGMADLAAPDTDGDRENQEADRTLPAGSDHAAGANPTNPVQAGAGSNAAGASTPAAEAGDPATTLEARLQWLALASEEDLNQPAAKQPMLSLSGLTPPEQRAFCTAITDRRRDIATEKAK